MRCLQQRAVFFGENRYSLIKLCNFRYAGLYSKVYFELLALSGKSDKPLYLMAPYKKHGQFFSKKKPKTPIQNQPTQQNNPNNPKSPYSPPPPQKNPNQNTKKTLNLPQNQPTQTKPQQLWQSLVFVTCCYVVCIQ